MVKIIVETTGTIYDAPTRVKTSHGVIFNAEKGDCITSQSVLYKEGEYAVVPDEETPEIDPETIAGMQEENENFDGNNA